MFNKSHVLAIALLSSMSASFCGGDIVTITGTPAAIKAIYATPAKVVAPLTYSDVLSEVQNHPYMYASLLAAALMVYRLESKGPCQNVDYDFNTLMRGNDSYMAKCKRALAWFDRYIIGQPYKSKSVKAKDGDLVISDPQEALGVMGVAQSNLKPILAGLGGAYFLSNPANGCLSKEKLDGMGWAVLALVLGLK